MWTRSRQGRQNNCPQGSYTLVSLETAPLNPRTRTDKKSIWYFTRGTVLRFSSRAIDRWGARQNRRVSQKNRDDTKVAASTRYTSMRTPSLRFRGKKESSKARTTDLQIRSLTPYPLGHADAIRLKRRQGRKKNDGQTSYTLVSFETSPLNPGARTDKKSI